MSCQYWYQNREGDIVSPKFNTMKELLEFNKLNRTNPKKTDFLNIDGKSVNVSVYRSKMPNRRGYSSM